MKRDEDLPTIDDETRSAAPHAGEARPSDVHPRGAALRYRILRPHARGGLGQVFLAQDLELNREVAVKEIRAEHAQDEDKRQRFVREAEITGGLEHPGIVPIYGLGRYEDGQPYYAMRFLRGQSLRQAIDELHRQKCSAHQHVVELRRLLTRFVTVCNTIAYAHSRGVLHRDIKPDNIMLGPFGEAFVVDWGLAKVVGDMETATAKVETAAHGDGELTLAGTPLGTPAYMSPEQAAGRLDAVGRSSDVYSLGATLYHLLTGRAPVTGHDIADVLQRVQRGELTAPELVNPRLAPPLAAICVKAMALDPNQRYPSAQVLAEDIENWLADEPVRAYSAPLFTGVLRWLRRNSVLVTVVAVFLAVLLLVGPFMLMVFALLAALERN